MARKKSKAQLEAELSLGKKASIIDGVVQVSLNLIRWGAIVLIARYSYLAIDSLAGKTTLADIGLYFLNNGKTSDMLAGFATSGSIAYGLVQRKLRKDTVERLQTRNIAREKEDDPGRSSSNLTKRGDTRPEDRE